MRTKDIVDRAAALDPNKELGEVERARFIAMYAIAMTVGANPEEIQRQYDEQAAEDSRGNDQ